MKRLSASILSADFGRLGDEIAAVESAGVDWIHVDVMDGHFVPNISIGPAVASAVRAATRLPIYVHLMISEPDRYVREFADAGADRIGVHAEAAVHLHRLVQTIAEAGSRPSVVLNPATPLSVLEYVLGDIDSVLVMTVNPGFGGQEFIEGMLDKIRRCREMIDAAGSKALIAVDGGVNEETIGDAAAAGADVFVAGSAIFGAGDPAGAVRRLRQRLESV